MFDFIVFDPLKFVAPQPCSIKVEHMEQEEIEIVETNGQHPAFTQNSMNPAGSTHMSAGYIEFIDAQMGGELTNLNDPTMKTDGPFYDDGL